MFFAMPRTQASAATRGLLRRIPASAQAVSLCTQAAGEDAIIARQAHALEYLTFKKPDVAAANFTGGMPPPLDHPCPELPAFDVKRETEELADHLYRNPEASAARQASHDILRHISGLRHHAIGSSASQLNHAICIGLKEELGRTPVVATNDITGGGHGTQGSGGIAADYCTTTPLPYTYKNGVLAVCPDRLDGMLREEKPDIVFIGGSIPLSGLGNNEIERLAQTCDKHNIPLVLDTSHRLGAYPPDIKDLDLPNNVTIVSAAQKSIPGAPVSGLVSTSDPFMSAVISTGLDKLRGGYDVTAAYKVARGLLLAQTSEFKETAERSHAMCGMMSTVLWERGFDVCPGDGVAPLMLLHPYRNHMKERPASADNAADYLCDELGISATPLIFKPVPEKKALPVLRLGLIDPACKGFGTGYTEEVAHLIADGLSDLSAGTAAPEKNTRYREQLLKLASQPKEHTPFDGGDVWRKMCRAGEAMPHTSMGRH